MHDIQLVESDVLPLQPHDSPLDWIITPTRSIETRSTHPRPTGVHWDSVRPEQFRDIPFLQKLKEQLTA